MLIKFLHVVVVVTMTQYMKAPATALSTDE
jgi:hypothetical protein